MVFLAGSRGSRIIVWPEAKTHRRIPVPYYMVVLAGSRGSPAEHPPPAIFVICHRRTHQLKAKAHMPYNNLSQNCFELWMMGNEDGEDDEAEENDDEGRVRR